MTFANLVKEKKAASITLVNKYSFPKTNKALWVVKLSDKKVLKKLLKWMSTLKTNFIVVSNESFDIKSNNIQYTSGDDFLDTGLDFIICDHEIGGICDCFSKGIAPIVIKNSPMDSLLSQFDPMKNEWNAYIYDELNEWCIFTTLIRYLENYKFTFDNKNLVKNIFES